MFRFIAELTTKRPLLVVLILGAVTAAAIGSSAGLSEHLSTQGFSNSSAQSEIALDELAEANGADARAQVVALIRPGGEVDSARGRALVKKTERLLDAEREMKIVRTPFDHDEVETSLISKDGKSAIVLANLRDGSSGGDAADRLREAFADVDGVQLGGWELTQHTVSATIASDLRRAEMIAFPLIFLIALFVFRGLIAALLPVLVGGITILISFALIRVVDGVTDLSVFALNLTTGMGLGLAIDYSLLMVTRYREELDAGSETAEAVRRTIATAGRTVAFSAVTVAGATAALGLFPLKFLYSMGVGGAIVALVSAVVALTLLPAVLMLLGPRINRFAIPRRSAEHSIGMWHRHATRVMAHPIPVALATTAVLLLMALPALGIRFTSVDATVLSQQATPRVVQETVENDFPRNDANSTLWVAVSSDRYDAPAVARDARRLKREAARVERRSDAVKRDARELQVATLTPGADPAELQRRAARIERDGASVKRSADRVERRQDRVQRSADRLDRFEQRIESYAARVERLQGVEETGELAVAGKGMWTFDIYSEDKRYSENTRLAVADIRALEAPGERWVGGASAAFVDQRTAINSRLVATLVVIGGVTFIALFLMTGSVVLPIKTFIMNLLTLAATFGILVAIFQENNLESLLRYEGQSALEMTQPVLLFAIAFGLATDYGVFLLSRIKELHDEGQSNSEAVANGVARTGRVISSAAVLFCAAILTFSTSGIIFVKELGIGLALAVAIDATIVRAMLVPALMELLGKYNWWAPRPLRRIHDRIGLSEGASAGAGVGAGAGAGAKAGKRVPPVAPAPQRAYVPSPAVAARAAAGAPNAATFAAKPAARRTATRTATPTAPTRRPSRSTGRVREAAFLMVAVPLTMLVLRWLDNRVARS